MVRGETNSLADVVVAESSAAESSDRYLRRSVGLSEAMWLGAFAFAAVQG